MSVTLSEIQTKIAETEAAITKVKTAVSYGKGDKNVQREQLRELRLELSSLRRDEAQLTAISNGSSSGVLTAKW